jgi:alkylhydroperoxidase/carboxymuconolactone decarboxylase family protein YurZ
MSTEPEQLPLLTLITTMTADSMEATTLDGQALMLVRIAALVASDAPPASYLLNLRMAGLAGVDETAVRGVLAAVAPIVGTPRIVKAIEALVEAFELKIELGELNMG